MRPGIRGWMGAIVLVVAASAIAATPSLATSVRVRPDYYGVSYVRMNTDPEASRSAILNQIAAGGLNQVRFSLAWVDVEPQAPVGGTHTYSYFLSDQLVTALAQRGLTGQITMTNAPSWNIHNQNPAQTLLCAPSTSEAPNDLQAYGLAMAALAKRYGTTGTFWTENPGLPYRPITVWEIWNEPNLTGSWCPAPEPARYAHLLAAAANDLHAADSHALVVSGGLPLGSPSGKNMKPLEFMQKTLAEVPALTHMIDAAGIHVYPAGDMDRQLKALSNFRNQFREAGIPDSMPLYMNELGWTTAGPYKVTEGERVQRYNVVPGEIPRTNCNVDGVVAHAWTTAQQNQTDQDFFGIANPVTGVPYASGTSFVHAVALMRGQTSTEAPHSYIKACHGMPEPDQDGDGHTDAHDYYPFDPTQWEGPPGWDTPKPVHAHRHAHKVCRKWYRLSPAWIPGDVAQHRTIVTACVARYQELRSSGELAPLIVKSHQHCRRTTPPARHWHGHHGVRHRRTAVTRCTFAARRKAFDIGY